MYSTNSFYSGAGIVQQLLNEFDFNEIKKLDKQNRLLLYQLNKSILKLKKFVQIFVYDKNAQLKLKELCKKRDLLIRRTKLVRKMFRKNTNPSSMILTVIPVLPPDLRPIVKMGNQIAASDLNRLYQRVIYRNDRLKKFLKDPATSQSYEMKYAQRLLQEAVDNLMQNGKSGPNSEKDARGRALKSLSDILKGKQGRFRQFLLGKRVDYSGRSVIVVGPKLKLHECGLPLEMAKELYLPFLLKSILNKNYAKTVVGAKILIKNNPSLANELLREIMQVTPVLLNRAPTLHRLGIQAFVPKLIEGRAILLHPLVCSAFNADFDGDQMAVHVPITVEARAEAWKMMLSINNLLSPATGDPLAIPSQDMVLGCYYLTTFSNTNNSKILRGSGMYFNHLYDVIKLYEQLLIDIHALVWVKWTHLIENGNDLESPLEIRISPFGQWQEISSNYQKMYDSNHNLLNLYMCTTPGRILLNLIIQKTIANASFP
jgi:DNA-directed RNA polymerase subunit beta'